LESHFGIAARADTKQVFTAQAFDDIGLSDISLHFRRAGENVFVKTLMEPVGDTGYFSVALDTDPSDLRSIEYYVQALDLNGNRTVSGFAFDPFIREITASVSELTSNDTSISIDVNDSKTDSEIAVANAQNENPVEQPKTNSISSRQWLYIALGVLAVGVAASQLGGDGGSSDGSTDVGNDSLVPLTVTIGDPLP